MYTNLSFLFNSIGHSDDASEQSKYIYVLQWTWRASNEKWERKKRNNLLVGVFKRCWNKLLLKSVTHTHIIVTSCVRGCDGGCCCCVFDFSLFSIFFCPICRTFIRTSTYLLFGIDRRAGVIFHTISHTSHDEHLHTKYFFDFSSSFSLNGLADWLSVCVCCWVHVRRIWALNSWNIVWSVSHLLHI